jgi:hypothetical protein
MNTGVGRKLLKFTQQKQKNYAIKIIMMIKIYFNILYNLFFYIGR